MIIKKKHIKLLTGIDAPLENPADDCLDRSTFARRIFKIIEGTPEAINMRVGIHGSWGSGKTTTMNFLKWYCREAGHPVVEYNPWQFHERQEAWKGFVSNIDKGIAIWQGKKLGSFKRKKTAKEISKKAREIGEITTVGKIIGSLILAPLEGLLEQTKQNVQKELNKILKDKRLFIFIDDLDRAEPNVLYDLLMLLNEIVDLNRCVYFIGLDVDVASQVISGKIGFEDSKEFLDKIINWPFTLPEPTDLEWQELLDNEIEKLDENVKKDALKAIFPQLPRNPRKFKHFLRFISGLHKSFLSRFDDNELDWKILYLAQLLRMEFPQVFDWVVSSKEAMEDLATGVILDGMKDNRRSTQKDETPKWIQKLNGFSQNIDEFKKARLHTLYKGLRESGGFISAEQLKNHLLVVEVPELFTWKEYHSLMKKLLSQKNEEISKDLSNLLKAAKKAKEVERVREFVKMLVRERDSLLTNIADMSDQQEMQIKLKDVKSIMRICSILLDIPEIFHGNNPIFNKEVFKEWYEEIAKWAYFKRKDGKKDIYTEVRELEAKLAKKLAAKIVSQASEILEALRSSSFERDFFDDKKTFQEAHKEVKKILEKALSDQIVDRFKRVDGIKELWGKDRYIPEKHLLFHKHPLFHNRDIYDRLKEISKESPDSLEIQKNFLEYVRMLFYAATEYVDWAEQEKARELLREKELMDIIWQAVISRPMNRRMVGSLERERIKIIKDIFQDKGALPVPHWWIELVSDVEDKLLSRED